MMDMLITFLTVLGVTLGREHLQNRHVKSAARAILEDDGEPITDPAEAVKEAWIRTNAERTKKAAAALRRQVEASEIRVRASVERAKENARGIDVEIVERDGTEIFR